MRQKSSARHSGELCVAGYVDSDRHASVARVGSRKIALPLRTRALADAAKIVIKRALEACQDFDVHRFFPNGHRELHDEQDLRRWPCACGLCARQNSKSPPSPHVVKLVTLISFSIALEELARAGSVAPPLTIPVAFSSRSLG